MSWRETFKYLATLEKKKTTFPSGILNDSCWTFVSVCCFSLVFYFFCVCSAVRMSGMDFLSEEHNETGITPINNLTFLRFSPTFPSTSAAASSSGRQGNVYVYVWLFLGLLAFLLTLLIISLHRLKNIISSSSSIPDCSSEGGSSFTNMEICSISSQRSTISTISAWGRCLRTVQTFKSP